MALDEGGASEADQVVSKDGLSLKELKETEGAGLIAPGPIGAQHLGALKSATGLSSSD